MFTMDRHDQERLYEDRTNPWDYESYMPTPGNRRYDQLGMPRAHSDDTMRMHEMMQYENEMARLQQEIARIDSQYRHLGLEMGLDTDKGMPQPKEGEYLQKELFPPISKGRKEGKFQAPEQTDGPRDRLVQVKSKKGDSDSSAKPQVRAQPMTSTPKSGTANVPEKRQVTFNDHKEDSPGVKKTTGVKIKPATYDGTSSWVDYKAHFDVCAELNGWSEKEKGMYLAVSLRGQAQGVFGNIANKSHDYLQLVASLEERFAPPNQIELYRVQLRERRQKASETLSELGQDIRRLTNQAYPSAPADLRETLAKEQFIDGLVSSDMRLRVKQARPVSLNDAVWHAVELEAFNRAERKQLEGQGYMRSTSEKVPEQKTSIEDDLKSLTKVVSDLGRSVDFLKRQKSWTPRPPGSNNRDQRQKQKRACFKCGSEEHLIAKCPQMKPVTTTENNQESHQAKLIASLSSGLYANCKINNYDAECLVDTGATLSLISCKAWDIINKSADSLNEFRSDIFTASGNKVEVRGKATVLVELCDIQCVSEMVVADIDVDIILGLDFLRKHNCKIDVTEETLSIQDKVSKLKLAGKLGCYRVTMSETVEIPPMTEMIIEGKVSTPALRTNDLGIIESAEKMFQDGKGLVAKSLVHTNGTVPLRMINLGNEVEKIYTGTHVANLSFVSNVRQIAPKHTKANTAKQVPEHLRQLYENTIHGLTMDQSKQVAKLFVKHESTFSENDNDLGRTGIITHRIPTAEAHPIKQPLRRLPVHMQDEAAKQINEMIEKDVIQKSSSPWASGIVMVEKKDGSKRFCVDYRRLNDITIKDAYPLPRIDDSLDQLSGAKWFSCLDFNSGYWQVEVEECDRAKTAFASKQGLYEFKVMPFGLCNAPATFERLMETVLAGLNWQICLFYLDDIIVIGRTFEDMIENLDKVLT